MDSYDSESRRIFQHFSRSTRFSLLRTAPNPKFQQKRASFFHIFTEISQNFTKFRSKSIESQRNFAGISPKFHRTNSEFRRVPKINSKFPIVRVFLTSRQAMHMVSRRMKQRQAQALSEICPAILAGRMTEPFRDFPGHQACDETAASQG